jgi:hypothetical protein
MKLNLIMLVVLMSVSATSLHSQEPSKEKIRAVVVPREVGLISVAYQPDCPLRFENARLFAGVEGGSLKDYRIRNIGKKPIKSITIGDSSGNTWSWDVAKERGPILPGRLFPRWSKENSVELVPLTNDLRARLNLQGPMRGVVVLMVIRVEFMDGSRYDDEKAFNALRQYLDDVQEKLYKLATLEQKKSLRTSP